MTARIVLCWLLLGAMPPLCARGDDAGPRNAIAQVRSDAGRLLAHRVRKSGGDPKSVVISDVVVAGDQALLSWASARQRGIMGLAVAESRWWDALDMTAAHAPQDCWRVTIGYPLTGSDVSPELRQLASAHNALYRTAHPLCRAVTYEPRKLQLVPAGGQIAPGDRSSMIYELRIAYSSNDASPGTVFNRIYARAPTSAEFLPNPVPPPDAGGPTDVAYFDIDLAGSKPVTFSAGTAIDMWAPFVLDDSLRYDLSFVSNDKPYGPYRGTLYDNVLHFELPPYTIVPGSALAAEISGWY